MSSESSVGLGTSAIANDLVQLHHVRYVAYGPFEQWYQWKRPEMVPVCYSASTKLYKRVKARYQRGNMSGSHDCFNRHTIGPFPFADGPLNVYSVQLIRVLQPLFDADEQFILSQRPHMQLAG